MSTLGKLAPGFSSRLNLLVDLLLLVGAVQVSAFWTTQHFHPASVTLAWLSLALVAVWLITATALRHYDPYAEHEVIDDIALVSILVLAVTTILALVTLTVPEGGVFPRIPQFLVTLWPLVLLLKVGVF